jgi:GTP-binding protein
MRTLAIVGRPNVGKSTLFNRLAGKRLALVHDAPGVTRDRREAEGQLGRLVFRLFDTAGLEEADGGSLEARMRTQTDRAIAEADACVFLIDARAGVTPFDRHFADLLRKASCPVILVANKCEGKAGDAGLYDAFALGLGEPVAISAEHGLGLGDLEEAIEAAFEEAEAKGADEDFDDDDDPSLRIAILGRPNVGKSTLVNRLLGEERMLTGPEAGITRDAIGLSWEWRGRPVKLFDTAGVRRRTKVTESLEKLSVADTLRAVRFAEVVVLVVDVDQAMEKQDVQLGVLVIQEGRGLVVAVNKWDLVEERSPRIKAIRERVEHALPQVKGLPVVALSAQTGEHMGKLMPAIEKVYDRWNARIPTAQLNQWLSEMTERHPPPAVSGKRIRLRYLTQAKSRPPTFVLFSTRAGDLPTAYLRYLTNGLREAFGLEATPIRIVLRKPKNPYDPGR